MTPIRVLLQTTIERAEDDWHIGRFSLLREHLRALRSPNGDRVCEVTTRDRATAADDPILSRLDDAPFDQVWLFAVDLGAGLTARESDALFAFHAAGGGVLTAPDHEDLGASLRGMPCLGRMHHFHRYQPEAEEERRQVDDRNLEISWPNYHSGWNGDLQPITVVGPTHPLLFRDGRSEAGGVLSRFPAHPHEGAIGAPAEEPAARVVAQGRSTLSGRMFNLVAVTDRPSASTAQNHGRVVAHSSFHHFCDYNWDTAAGAPSFVNDPPGVQVAQDPRALEDIRAYVGNAVRWLSGRDGT